MERVGAQVGNACHGRGPARFAGPGGYAVYTAYQNHREDPGTLEIMELSSGDGESFAGLWRYPLSVDLVDVVKARTRPLDEPTALLLTDPRRCWTVAGDDDGLWLRLVDVPAAPSAREYEGGPW